MTSKLLFPEEYLLTITGSNLGQNLKEELYPEYFPLKDDPYHGLDSTVARKINSKYIHYQENEKVFFYFSRAFLEGEYTGKPFFPYFKGEIRNMEDGIQIQGIVKYNKILSFFLPVIMLGLVLLVYLLDISWLFIIVPILLIIITKISSTNLKKELIMDLENKIAALNQRTSNANHI